MKLLRDVARCAGRFGLGPDDPICARRDQCARYVALIAHDGADDDGAWNRVSVLSGMCRDGGDHFIPLMDGKEAYGAGICGQTAVREKAM